MQYVLLNTPARHCKGTSWLTSLGEAGTQSAQRTITKNHRGTGVAT